MGWLTDSLEKLPLIGYALEWRRTPGPGLSVLPLSWPGAQGAPGEEATLQEEVKRRNTEAARTDARILGHVRNINTNHRLYEEGRWSREGEKKGRGRQPLDVQKAPAMPGKGRGGLAHCCIKDVKAARALSTACCTGPVLSTRASAQAS